MKKARLFLPIILFLTVILLQPMKISAENFAPRTRTTTEFRFQSENQKIQIRTIEVSMDSGMKKTHTYEIANTDAILKSENGKIMFYGDVYTTDSPTGLKAYTVVQQYKKFGDFIYSVLEFDYRTKSIRKIREHSDTAYSPIKIYAKQGIYRFSEYGARGEGTLYSLVDGKLVSSVGSLIEPQEVIETHYALSPQPIERDYLVYCSNDQKANCNLLNFGGVKGIKIKVNLNSGEEDPVYGNYRTFYLGNTKVKVQGSSFKTKKDSWLITAFKNNAKVSLFQGKAASIATYVSPNQKYLVLGIGTGTSKSMKLVYQIFDIKTLKLVQTYVPKYSMSPEHFKWVSDDLFIMDYFFSDPGRYPLEFYHIPSSLKVPIDYGSYSNWLDSHAWDNFSYDDFIYPAHPAGIFSKDAALSYSGQPAFYSNLIYYAPLKEFASTFGITYEVEENNLKLYRNGKQELLSLNGDKVLNVQDKIFVALGTWNRTLGIKPAYTQNTIYNSEISVLDEVQ